MYGRVNGRKNIGKCQKTGRSKKASRHKEAGKCKGANKYKRANERREVSRYKKAGRRKINYDYLFQISILVSIANYFMTIYDFIISKDRRTIINIENRINKKRDMLLLIETKNIRSQKIDISPKIKIVSILSIEFWRIINFEFALSDELLTYVYWQTMSSSQHYKYSK